MPGVGGVSHCFFVAETRQPKVSRQSWPGKSQRSLSLCRGREASHKRSQRAAGSALPPKRQLCSPRDCSDRGTARTRLEGFCQSRAAGYSRARVPILPPTVSLSTTWELFKSVSLRTKEPDESLHLKEAGQGWCCFLQEC